MTEQSNTPVPAKTAKETLKDLQQAFPVIRDCQPLAIGIDKQVLAQQPEINRKMLRSALGMHTKSLAYLKNLQNAATRFNLDGTPADAVSDEQRALAAKTLHEFFKKRAEQRKAKLAEEAAAAAAEAADRERMAKLNQLAEKFSRN